jgi:benzodiazapine receptor
VEHKAQQSKLKTIIKFIVSIVVCQAAGIIGSLFTTPAIPTWYAGLNKPVFTPPNWLFAPVWTTLYLLMGISLFLIWNKTHTNPKARLGIAVFAGQLVFNILWSIAFFGLQSPLLGVIVIVMLVVLICSTIVVFIRVQRIAAILLIPYLLWTGFATALNIALFVLNQGQSA